MNWIDVKDRLPESEDDVLVLVCQESDLTQQYYRTIARRESGKWVEGEDTGLYEIGTPEAYCVTHWQPLPELPTPASQGDEAVDEAELWDDVRAYIEGNADSDIVMAALQQHFIITKKR